MWIEIHIEFENGCLKKTVELPGLPLVGTLVVLDDFEKIGRKGPYPVREVIFKQGAQHPSVYLDVPMISDQNTRRLWYDLCVLHWEICTNGR